jgi:ABC-2 type transport system permease protein
MNKIKFIAIKEVRHILRDPRSLIIAILMPMLMTLLYGYAVNLDIKNIKLAVIDLDHSPESRTLAEKFYHSGYFIKAEKPPEIMDPERLLQGGWASAVLTIPPGFSKNLIRSQHYEMGLMIDGSDNNLSAAASNYSTAILQNYLMDLLPVGVQLPGIRLSQQVLYNPDLKSSHFFVPGLIAIILMMISALLTSVTIAREKESGTMEQLLTSPVTPRQIIIGKVIPYVGLALLDGILVLVFGVVHFGVPFVGSVFVLLIFGLIYVIAALSLGILISTLVPTQQLAMMVAQLVTVLPSVMLSGYIFEIKNMPKFLQLISYAVPARYFLVIIRGVMLKGSNVSVLWVEAVSLIVLTIVMLTVAAKKFKLKLG